MNTKVSNISIKIASQEDAIGWAHMLQKFDAETNFSMFEQNERSFEIGKYETKIANAIRNPKSAIFFAIENTLLTRNIVGYLYAEAYKIKKMDHAVKIGIGILESYCSSGIGSQLAENFLIHAKQNNIKRIEACIIDSNLRSINLAKKFGFSIEGIKRKSIRNDNYHDEYLMALIID